MPRWLLSLLPLTLAVPASAEPAVSFEADVRPILKAYCFECHGEGDKPKGGLDLRLARLLRQGGKSGPGVVAGKPDESLLLERVANETMPPGKKKLSAEQIAVLRRWVAAGAPVAATEPATLAAGMHLTPEDRAYWAFQPVKRPAVPGGRDGETIRNPVDTFLLEKLRANGLGFNSEADRPTLIRRLSFDLLGLPPTPEEVERGLNDESADWYEKVVERLLASPQHGERWARHWLDVAGYADSEGYSADDAVRKDAWKYRDYVVRAFNADLPFDRFIREQLAGDEMLTPPYKNLTPDQVDKLVATGFLRLAADGTGSPGVEATAARNQVVGDTLKIVSAAFLGVTVGCAQCHNHRYDPLPQTDYYRLRALLEPAYDVKNWRAPAARQVSLYTDDDRAKAAAIEKEAAAVEADRLKKQQEFIQATFEKQLARVPEDQRDAVRGAWSTSEAKRTAAQKKLLQEHPSANVTAGSLYLYDSAAAAELTKLAKAAADLRATKPAEEFVRALTEVPGKVPATHLFHRGDPDQPKEPVAPGGLTILDDRLPLVVPERPLPGGTTGRRTALAAWLTDPRHPLVPRVLVNRFWMHLFGRGLVGTPGDFGRLGESPTHPELLDWLAAEFVASGWSVKHLHRLLVTSTAYRQASRRDAARDKVDPENRLLGRMSLRRLDAESVRDAVLKVSGQFTQRVGGPPVPVKENEVGQFVLGIDNQDGAGRFTAEVPLPPGDVYRRSLYVQVRRSRPLNVLDAFDWAAPDPCCEKRNSSTVAPQALLLMNGDFALAQAASFAARVKAEAGDDVAAQVTRAWQLAYGVPPTEKETAAGVAFVAGQSLPLFCQALLGSNRFLYVD